MKPAGRDAAGPHIKLHVPCSMKSNNRHGDGGGRGGSGTAQIPTAVYSQSTIGDERAAGAAEGSSPRHSEVE